MYIQKAAIHDPPHDLLDLARRNRGASPAAACSRLQEASPAAAHVWSPVNDDPPLLSIVIDTLLQSVQLEGHPVRAGVFAAGEEESIAAFEGFDAVGKTGGIDAAGFLAMGHVIGLHITRDQVMDVHPPGGGRPGVVHDGQETPVPDIGPVRVEIPEGFTKGLRVGDLGIAPP